MKRPIEKTCDMMFGDTKITRTNIASDKTMCDKMEFKSPQQDEPIFKTEIGVRWRHTQNRHVLRAKNRSKAFGTWHHPSARFPPLPLPETERDTSRSTHVVVARVVPPRGGVEHTCLLNPRLLQNRAVMRLSWRSLRGLAAPLPTSHMTSGRKRIHKLQKALIPMFEKMFFLLHPGLVSCCFIMSALPRSCEHRCCLFKLTNAAGRIAARRPSRVWSRRCGGARLSMGEQLAAGTCDLPGCCCSQSDHI